jgi:hypothetical protein
VSKKKDKMIDKLADKVSDLEQEIHERELDRRKFLCILEDMDDFFTRNLIPKLFINKEASKRYAFMKPIQGYEELAEETFFMKTWVIDDKQPRPPHERAGYTRINKYPERGSYKWGMKDE